MSFNKVILVGNITRDIEMKYTPSGMAVASTGIAMNEKRKEKEEVTFVDIKLFGSQAELANKYLVKGREVLVEGKLKLDQWEDKETKQKRSKLYVVADRIQFVGKKDGGNTTQASASAPQKTADKVATAIRQSEPGELEIDEDQVPF